jgi:hypothetical protein
LGATPHRSISGRLILVPEIGEARPLIILLDGEVAWRDW